MDINALPPNQYKAAVFLLSAARGSEYISIGKSDLSEALGISTAQANRLLSGLVSSGVIERIRRGCYRISVDSDDPARIKNDPSRIKNDSSRIKNDSSRIISDRQKTIPVLDVAISHTASRNSSNTLLTSNEVSKGPAGRKAGKEKGKPVRYIDDDADLQAVGTAPSNSPRTAREARRYRHQVDHLSKPRETWDVVDAAHFFAASIETRKPYLFGRVATKRLVPVLTVWLRDYRATPVDLGEAMDAFFADSRAMDSLQRGVDPLKHFLNFLKTYRPKASAPRWASVDETARVFDPSILETS